MSYESGNKTQVPDDAKLPPEIQVFVNERTHTIARGSTVLDAVRASSPESGTALAEGRARVTDSRGLPLEATDVITGGAILRVLPMRDKQAEEN